MGRDLKKKITKATVVCLLMVGGVFGLGSVLAFSNFKPLIIYGEDNRLDLYNITNLELLRVADSTVAMIPLTSIIQDASEVDPNQDQDQGEDQAGDLNQGQAPDPGQEAQKFVTLKAKAFGVEFDLCKDETFYSQPAAALCSGFLVGEDLIATAGHCITSERDCATQAFVFGYRMQDELTPVMKIPKGDVYKCKKIIKREQLDEGQDYALIQLDRPVLGHEPLKLSERLVQPGDAVFVVGHPSGLPTKVGGGAHVRETKKTYFKSNLDTYGGNSGSAVFDANTFEVIGILVRGDQDFKWISEKSCTGSNICANDECRGEDATQVSFIKDAMATL